MVKKPDIVFYHQYPVAYFGVLSMSARLESKGIKVDVVIDSLEEDPVETLKAIGPGLVGVSVLSPEHRWLVEEVAKIKAALPETKVLVGGVHAMLYAAEIMQDTGADFVCNSEGEVVAEELLKDLGKPSPDFSSIRGLVYRDGSDGKVVHNELAPLVQYDDGLVESQAIYYARYPELAKDAVHRFISSRGCPYRCSFCYNTNLQDAFNGMGKFVRQKSVENFIEEVATHCRKYPAKSLFFYDDLFTYNKKWLYPFLDAFKNEVGLPFMCTTRANVMSEETARRLKEAGCRTISYGIETGDEELRKGVLNKDVTDEQVISCGQALRGAGIKVQTANMFCLPGETVDMALSTIEINIKSGTDYAFTALFMPFPNTDLARHCIEGGYLDPGFSLRDLPSSFLNDSVLTLADKEKIKNVHRMAFFFIKWPLFFKLAGWTVRLTFLGPVFHLVFLFSNILRHKEERGISMWAALRYAWRLRKSV